MAPAIQVTTEFSQQNDQLAFKQGSGTGSLETQVALAVAPVEDLTANVFGGGTPYLTLQVPENPDYLKEVGLQLFYGASFQAWSFESSYERRIDCKYPGECSQAGAAVAGMPWQLMPRRYLADGYARFSAAEASQRADRSPGGDVETILLTNIYPRPQPSLALGDGKGLLVYVHDDPEIGRAHV